MSATEMALGALAVSEPGKFIYLLRELGARDVHKPSLGDFEAANRDRGFFNISFI
jgi:hypothetical protein